MEDLIAALVIEIKKDQRYQTFLKLEQKLQQKNIAQLLYEYQEALDTYHDVQQYKEYIDISESEQRVKELKIQISKNKDIQEYYKAYHEVNELLEQVTELVFKDISKEIDMARYVL